MNNLERESGMTAGGIDYREFDLSRIKEVKDIYRQASWNAYLQDDEKLARAFQQSLHLLGAFDADRLVGFVRCVGDGEHILVVQDLIVVPEYQQRGIGTALFKTIMKKYSEVRMFLVITDIGDEVDNKFYQSFGMKKLEEQYMAGYVR